MCEILLFPGCPSHTRLCLTRRMCCAVCVLSLGLTLRVALPASRREETFWAKRGPPILSLQMRLWTGVSWRPEPAEDGRVPFATFSLRVAGTSDGW